MNYYSILILILILLLLFAFFKLLAPILIPILLIYLIYRIFVPRHRSTTYTFTREEEPEDFYESKRPPKHGAIDVEYSEHEEESDDHDS